MNTNLLPCRAAMIFSVFASLLLFAVRATGATIDFSFSSPQAGSTYRIGDVLRIEFAPTDTNVRLSQDMIGFTNNNGRTWVFLNLALYGTDTVSLLKHYDWTIPDSVTSSRNSSLNVSTIGDSCRICIAYYQTKATRGASKPFSIKGSGASSIAVSRQTFFARRPAMTYVGPEIGFVRAGNPRPSACFSFDGRIQRNVNFAMGALSDARKGAGIIVIP